jgi:radical SAM protein with 4Fe4S-binding SPASM domain
VISRLLGRCRQRHLVFEVTSDCNHRCPHCYNAWKNPGRYEPPAVLGTRETLAMLADVLDQTNAKLVSLSGGEPLLRPDLLEIVDFLAGRGVAMNLLTNGTLLDERTIGRLGEAISIYELPLLSCRREVHDRLSGKDGAFDGVTLAVANLKKSGHRVVCVFVATAENIDDWRSTAELAIALGADGIMLNRFNAGGAGRENLDRLAVRPSRLAAMLDEAQQIAETYSISISCSIAMPPCLFNHNRWPSLGFGFCSAGTANAYYTLDPLGNLRPCNHSPTILGNVRESSFAELAHGQTMRAFMAARPAMCGGCKWEKRCKGGCKAAAEACYGSLIEPEPILRFSGPDAPQPPG